MDIQAYQHICADDTYRHAENRDPLVFAQPRNQLTRNDTTYNRGQHQWRQDQATIRSGTTNDTLHEEWEEEDAAEQAHAKDDCYKRQETKNAIFVQDRLNNR